ncbi:chemosensory receptor b [Plakobranchus ocellatus]|uniref:Chemosensory receptor b n=1 Tax=Plakobranchus ocellatus TaxID=259542 RepID=A0AAV3Y0X1_9GAST|nr:chemosensory receptor b [Plakobranchus ocellatus]
MSLVKSSASNSTPFGSTTSSFYKAGIWTYNMLLPTWPAIILFGLFANTTNIVVFIKTGVKDNVTTLMLALSVSDLLYLTLMTPLACAFVILHFQNDWSFAFDTDFITELLYWPAIVCYDFSAFISVLLGVTRCACVAKPLKFKSVFTKARTVKLVLASFVLALSLRMPIISVYRVARRKDPDTNISYLYVAKHNKESMTRINDILNRNSLLYINFVIMITCVCILSYKLYQASKKRRSYSSALAPDWKGASEKQGNQGLSSKDLHVIQSVVLVGSIFIMSQAPFLMYSTARLVIPGFDADAGLHYIFIICTTISLTCSYLNATVNIFVYYNYNSKYKAAILSAMKDTKLKF